ncbi:uncharacterized protein MELLADRAFT_111187 [Melampsora larici-populina 98AG31]|uniref:Uncharacterized protein n=1 Tax=Melampsora larici-populina (strain 98AG31 / pathotype 3-4-7) TaxID=747676 RepID=F4S2B2_MELLP|nr:uncharacterized protein MELLADRAFT_111187 [Melampsora larici-populina 98AG31]EGG01145.1 hypothetical protein MELLADRAFT_111187 [Melampsora larici-populina 98AG31]
MSTKIERRFLFRVPPRGQRTMGWMIWMGHFGWLWHMVQRIWPNQLRRGPAFPLPCQPRSQNVASGRIGGELFSISVAYNLIDSVTSIQQMDISATKRTARIGPYCKLTMGWSARINVQAKALTQKYRKVYDASVVLDEAKLPIPVALVEEFVLDNDDMTGVHELRGVVVGGGSNIGGRLVMERSRHEPGSTNNIFAGIGPGLNVRGRGLVLKDSLVEAGPSGSEWRVAVVLHREWDMEPWQFTCYSVVVNQLTLALLQPTIAAS